jgi:CHAT domain-containing protein/Flp pilus assembly protein TadD
MLSGLILLVGGALVIGSQDNFDAEVGRINVLIRQANQVQEANPKQAVEHLRSAHALADGLRTRGQNSAAQQQAALNNQANVCNLLGKALIASGEHREAIPQFKQCLELKQQLRGRGDSIYTAWALGDVGLPYRALGEYEEAERWFQQAVDTFDRLYTANRSTLEKIDYLSWARHLNNLGYTHWLMGKYDGAVPHLRRGRGLLEFYANESPNDTNVQSLLAELLNTQGLVFRSLGQYPDALEAYENSLSRRDRVTSTASDRALIRSNIGSLHSLLGRNELAIEFFNKSLELWPRTSPDRARTLNALGYVLHKIGKLREAEEAYREALTIWRGLKETHVHMASTESSLGWLLYERRQYAEAERLLRSGLELREARLPKSHPHVALSHQNLAALFASTGQDQLPFRHMTQARKLLRDYVSQRLPFQPEESQLSFLLDEADPGSHAATLHVSLSLGVKLKDDAKTLDESANWLLNGKAVAMESLSVQALAQRSDTSPLAKQLRDVQVRLAGLTLTSSGSDASQIRQLNALETKEQELRAALVKEAGFVPGAQPWVDVQAVRAKLPRGSVYIDIAHYRPWRFEQAGAERWGTPLYAAWVMHQGRPDAQVVPLGDAKVINDAVATFRKVLKEATPDPDKPENEGTIRTLGRRDSEKLARDALKKLSDLLLTPLARAGIHEAEHWIISPDADLWFVPWCALPIEAEYAIQKHAISYLVSGRDLLRDRPAGGRGTALVLARPDYGDYDGKKGTGLEFVDLKDTEDEAKAIVPSLQRISGGVRGPLFGKNASQQALLANPRPDVLVVSTHGYFLDDEMMDRLKRPRLRNPLSRCGLALSDAHQTADGILDGTRVTRLDLTGTRLAVLSACDTGVGKINRGEGVASLRQAFHLAGARTVAATLWQVPSATSKDLVIEYFRHLADNPNHASAMRKAQVRVIETPDANGLATSHPLFWAAYALTGPAE